MSRFHPYFLRRGKDSSNPKDAELFDELHLPILMDANKGYDVVLLIKTLEHGLFLYKIREVCEEGEYKRAFHIRTRRKLPKRFLVIKAGIGAYTTGYGYVPIFEHKGGCSSGRSGSADFVVP